MGSGFGLFGLIDGEIQGNDQTPYLVGVINLTCPRETLGNLVF